MMKVTVTSGKPERKMVAIVGATGGLFLPSGQASYNSVYIGNDGIAEQVRGSIHKSSVLPGRVAVYEGDTVTLQF